MVPDSRVELERPKSADFERVISNLDYLFTFNFTWLGGGCFLPVIKVINTSGSLYTFIEFTQCLARPPSFLFSAEFNHFYHDYF